MSHYFNEAQSKPTSWIQQDTVSLPFLHANLSFLHFPCCIFPLLSPQLLGFSSRVSAILQINPPCKLLVPIKRTKDCTSFSGNQISHPSRFSETALLYSIGHERKRKLIQNTLYCVVMGLGPQNLRQYQTQTIN